MTQYFKPRMDILPVAQQRLWPELHPACKLGLVLYGGTAIALRLGHRFSALALECDEPATSNRITEPKKHSQQSSL